MKQILASIILLAVLGYAITTLATSMTGVDYPLTETAVTAVKFIYTTLTGVGV